MVASSLSTPLFAYAAAFLIAVAHVAGPAACWVGSRARFQTADQVAMGALGLVPRRGGAVRAGRAAGGSRWAFGAESVATGSLGGLK